ncbi:NAD-dependent epimerase/dehydratase family protein [Ruegeria lacuscaerulensis]|uniref:NAD-dependent epimerase/dehydratase family protein n=1 Tax=Ruegeria lacuscaerulensis TaxID=55218 RepID=UPI00147E16B4|nr:NAD(P)-dependent oxidoreductase [Ruegeria lacuscaerulensis]
MMSSKQQKPTVLVTGAAGFIGRACVRQLATAGCRVIATYRSGPPPQVSGDVIWVNADTTDTAAIQAVLDQHHPTHLLALAWYMGPGNQQALENFRRVQHSIDLLFAFAQAGGQRVTFCGSCMEYDWSKPIKLHERETPLTPATEYGAAKAGLATAFEKMCGALDLSGAWARPFFLYGPGENPRRLAADVVISLLQGREALCTHGRQKRDFLHVDDVASAMVALLNSDLEGPVNIGSGTAIPLSDLILEIARQIGAEDLVRLGAREARPGDPPLVEANNTRLRTELGWSPKFTLETGVADTIAWWRREIAKET